MMDLEHLSTGIANVLQYAGFDPHQIAETGRLLAIEGQMRRGQKSALGLSVPEADRLVPR